MQTGGTGGKGKFIWLGLFAVAMGFLEAIVVVYLRELYYPGGFRFPLAGIPPKILFIETLREACTLLMLFSLAAVAGRGFYGGLSCFLLVFGIWDIFYYVGLKVLLGWPPSLLTWDILFLIPVAWTAPVLAPLVSAATMILLGLLILILIDRCGMVSGGPAAWGLLIFGALVQFFTFVKDYLTIVIEGGFIGELLELAGNEKFMRIALAHVPESFSWSYFSLGEAMILLAMVIIRKNTFATHRLRNY